MNWIKSEPAVVLAVIVGVVLVALGLWGPFTPAQRQWLEPLLVVLVGFVTRSLVSPAK